MLSSHEEAVAGRERRDDRREYERFPATPDHPPIPQPSAVDLRFIAPGTELVVETRNSCYRFVMLDDHQNALVQGGRRFEQETTARIDGCTIGGCLLKLGWIAKGLCLELSARGKRIVTSPVCSISVARASLGDARFRT
jgi:hypothetical protein